MDSQQYFTRMNETSMHIDNIIFQELAPLQRTNPELYTAVNRLAEKRRRHPKVRGHFAYEAFQAFRNGEGLEVDGLRLGAGVELELNAMYYRNQVFDTKEGVYYRSFRDVVDNWTAETFSREAAQEVLTYYFPLQRDELVKLLSDANRVFCIGQERDVIQNIYPQVKTLTFDEQVKLSNQRTYEINASFFEKIARMSAIVAREKNEERIKSLEDFGRNYGMALQIMNDISDFVPPRLQTGTTEKEAKDAYSDVRESKMTLPIIWLLNNGSLVHREILDDIIENRFGYTSKHPLFEELTKILVQSGAIDFAFDEIRKYRNQAKSALKRLFTQANRRYLSSMCVIFDSNRYIKTLDEFRSGGIK